MAVWQDGRVAGFRRRKNTFEIINYSIIVFLDPKNRENLAGGKMGTVAGNPFRPALLFACLFIRCLFV